jgi:hypothetical protein
MLQYHHYLELMSFIVGLACMSKRWPITYKILVFFSGLTFLVEILGYQLSFKYENNNWLYNIFSPLECIIILYLFSQIIMEKKLQLIILYFIPLMIAATVFTYILQPNFFIYNSYAHTVYLVLWVIICGFYFIDVMINDNRVSLIKQPGFWLATGILFFSVIFIILQSLYNIFTTLPNYKIIVRYFIIVANTFMYVGFVGTFICQNIATKYYSPSSQPA